MGRARFARSWLPVLLDVTVLILLPILFFWGVLFTTQFSLPYDISDQHYMYQFFVVDALKSGTLPLWTPYLFSGYPCVGDPLYQTFYPPNLFLALLTPAGSGLAYDLLEWQAVLHYSLLAVFTYLLARDTIRERWGALVAAVSLTFCGFMVTHASHLSALNALAWFPLIILFSNKALRQRSATWAALAGGVYGVAILAGHTQAALHMFYVLVLLTSYHVYRVLAQPPPLRYGDASQPPPLRYGDASQRGVRTALRVGLLFLMVVALALGVAMVQLLPAAEFAEKTGRAHLDFYEAALSSLMPQHLVTLLIPNFFSFELTPNILEHSKAFWGFGDVPETYLYMGLLPLFLAGLAVVYVQRRATRALAGLGTLALLMAMGNWTFLQQAAYFLLPGFAAIRRPYNSIFFFYFAVALLAGYGMTFLLGQNALDSKSRLQRYGRGLLRVCAGGVGFLAMLYVALGYARAAATPQHLNLSSIINSSLIGMVVLAVTWALVMGRAEGWLARAALGMLIVGIIAFDTFSNGSLRAFNTGLSRYTNIGRDYVYEERNDTIRFLQADPDYMKNSHYRIETRDVGSLWGNGGNIWKVPSTGGYSVLEYKDYVAFRGLISSYNSRLFDLLNVKYVITIKPLQELDSSVDPNKFELVFQQGSNVYRNAHFLPRALLVPTAKVLGHEDVLRALQDPSFDPLTTVLLEESYPGPELTGWDSAEGAYAHITGYTPNTITVDASLPQPGFLFLSEVFYPGWRVWVDDIQSKIYRANYTFRAVYLEAGQHKVVFSFEPRSFQIGRWLTALTVTCILTVLLLSLLKRTTGRRFVTSC